MGETDHDEDDQTKKDLTKQQERFLSEVMKIKLPFLKTDTPVATPKDDLAKRGEKYKDEFTTNFRVADATPANSKIITQEWDEEKRLNHTYVAKEGHLVAHEEAKMIAGQKITDTGKHNVRNKGNVDKTIGYVMDPETADIVAFDSGKESIDRDRNDPASKSKYVHHSSPFAGGDVAGAGEIKTKGGKVTYVDNESGHYLPKLSHLQNVVIQLLRSGVMLDTTLTDVDGNEEDSYTKPLFDLSRKVQTCLGNLKAVKAKIDDMIISLEDEAAEGSKPEIEKTIDDYRSYVQKISDALDLLRKVGIASRNRIEGTVGLREVPSDPLAEVNWAAIKRGDGPAEMSTQDFIKGHLPPSPEMAADPDKAKGLTREEIVRLTREEIRAKLEAIPATHISEPKQRDDDEDLSAATELLKEIGDFEFHLDQQKVGPAAVRADARGGVDGNSAGTYEDFDFDGGYQDENANGGYANPGEYGGSAPVAGSNYEECSDSESDDEDDDIETPPPQDWPDIRPRGPSNKR